MMKTDKRRRDERYVYHGIIVCTIIIMMRNMRFESETETSSGNPTDQTHNLINLPFCSFSLLFLHTKYINNIINEILLHVNITLTLSQSSFTFLFTFHCYQHLIKPCRILCTAKHSKTKISSPLHHHTSHINIHSLINKYKKICDSVQTAG